MKKKVILGIFGLLLSGILVFSVMPVSAAGGSTTTPPATQQTGKGQLLKRILSIQDQATLDALLAKAEANGKLTAAQVAQIDAFWTAHHAQFTKAKIVQRVLGVQDEAKLQAFLDKAVSAGKLTADQASKIITLWETAHNT